MVEVAAKEVGRVSKAWVICRLELWCEVARSFVPRCRPSCLLGFHIRARYVLGCRTRLSRVSVNQQRFQVLVLFWAATNACLIWITGKRVWYSTFYKLIHPEIIIKEFIILWHQVLQYQSNKLQGRGHLSQEMKIHLGAQFQCRHLQESRRPWVHHCLWRFRRVPWLDNKDSKYLNLNSTNSLIPNHSWFGRYDSKIKWLPVLIFHRIWCYGSKKWRWLIYWKNWSPRDPHLEIIFQIWRDARRENCFCFE